MGYWDNVTPQSVANASNGFNEFKIGDNEAYIKMVEEKHSESGNPMLVITFANNAGAEIKHYIVDGEYKLSKLKQLYQSFSIPLGSQDIEDWRGKRGIVVCKQGEPYNGSVYNKVNYLRPLSVKKAEQKPQAATPANALPKQAPAQIDNFDDDIPWE